MFLFVCDCLFTSRAQQENRFLSEMDSHKTKLDVEYDQLMGNFGRELDNLREKHLKDLDKWVRQGVGEVE